MRVRTGGGGGGMTYEMGSKISLLTISMTTSAMPSLLPVLL